MGLSISDKLALIREYKSQGGKGHYLGVIKDYENKYPNGGTIKPAVDTTGYAQASRNLLLSNVHQGQDGFIGNKRNKDLYEYSPALLNTLGVTGNGTPTQWYTKPTDNGIVMQPLGDNNAQVNLGNNRPFADYVSTIGVAEGNKGKNPQAYKVMQDEFAKRVNIKPLDNYAKYPDGGKIIPKTIPNLSQPTDATYYNRPNLNLVREGREYPSMRNDTRSKAQQDTDKQYSDAVNNPKFTVGDVLKAPLISMAHPIDAISGNNKQYLQESRINDYNPNTSTSEKLVGSVKQGLSYVPNAAMNLSMGVGLGSIAKNVGKSIGKDFASSGTAPAFKSEINWTKWNKEISTNKSLLNEYHSIEETTKANSTWMKNPNGSTFTGTPEQFVQQQSSNFKSNLPNAIKDEQGNVQISYHGSPNKLEGDFFDPSKDIRGDATWGRGIYSTPKKSVAEHYAGRFNSESTRGNVHELYINSNKNQSEFVKTLPFDNKYHPYDPNYVDPRSKLKKGFDYFKPDEDIYEQLTPYSNYPKSAIGNNGKFDMTNPNIYKGLVPTTIGAGTLLQSNNKYKNLKKQ